MDLYIITFMIIFFPMLVYFIIKYLNKNKDRYTDIKISNMLLLENVKNLYTESLEYINSLNTQNFPGARNALVKLKTYESKIFIDINNTLVSTKRYYSLIKIMNELNQISSEIGSMVDTLADNRSLHIDISQNLEVSLSQVKNKILNSIENAKATIHNINKDNPDTVWRNINIVDIDRQIEYHINKSHQEYRLAIKSVETGDYESASQYANASMIYMTNAFTIIQNIFDVNNMINESKKIYNKYILKLPKIISHAESVCSEKHMNTLNEVKDNYTNMQQILNDNTKKVDWTIISVIINLILSKSDKIIYNK